MENLKVRTPLPVIYTFGDGKIYRLPYLHLGYKKNVYGVEVAGLYLNKLYYPNSNWPDADKLAREKGERLMKSTELLVFWKNALVINDAMKVFRANGIEAHNIRNGYHWGWADWKGPWKDSMCCGHLIPRYETDNIDNVRTILNAI